MERIKRLGDALGVRATALVTRPISIRYLTGFAIDPGERFLALAVRANETPQLFVPALEAERAKAGGHTFEIVPVDDQDNLEDLLGRAKPLGGSLFLEKGHVTLDLAERLERAWGRLDVADLDPVITQMRRVKDEAELEAMRRAGRLIDRVIAEAKTFIRPGVTEAAVARMIDTFMGELGTAPSFTTIVLFGRNAAYPHGTPGERTLERGDAVLFDIGCRFEGYASDITRTLFFEEASPQMREVYDLVFAAHEAAAATLRAGVRAMDIDRAARDVIEAGGHGEHFTHRIGHGLGLEVHEGPSLHGANENPLPADAVVTIEPGVYLPGVGGVRIEDAYRITEDGAERLTHAPRSREVLSGRS